MGSQSKQRMETEVGWLLDNDDRANSFLSHQRPIADKGLYSYRVYMGFCVDFSWEVKLCSVMRWLDKSYCCHAPGHEKLVKCAIGLIIKRF